jgi:hypothetical protein
MMTQRERFAACIFGGGKDRLFRYDYGPWPFTMKRWRQEGFPADRSFEEYFAYDRLQWLPIRSGHTYSPFYPEFSRTVIDEGLDWEVIRDVDGITKKVFKMDSDLSMPQFLKYPVENRVDYKSVRSRLLPENVRQILGDRLNRPEYQDPGRDFPVLLSVCGAYGHPRNLLGDEHLAYMLYDDPELIVEILRDWLAFYREIIRQAARATEIDCLLIWEDMCFKSGPLLSPKHFVEFITPVYTELIDFAKAHKVKAVVVDSDGDVRKLLPLFAGCGVDAVLPFEVQAGMDVVELAKQMQPKLGIIGGIDKRALALERSDIRKEVDRVMPYMLEYGRYIPTLDHTVPPNVSLDNYACYVECVRRYETV